MYNFNTSNNHFWKNFLTQISLLFITVTLIVWFLPRHEGPVFRYDIGKPWMYGSLIASFDFPIFKTDEAIKEEQDSLTKYFQPYYYYDASVEKAQIDNFLKDFQEGLPGLNPMYKAIICDRLHQLYQTGIIKTTEYNTLNKDTTNMIRVVDKKQATSLQINKVHSVFSAYEKLFNDSRLEPHKQLLQRCNLNNYIEPNLIYDKERSQTELNDLLSGISQASGLVISGQKIVDRGDIVDEHTYLVLNSLEREMKRINDADSKMAITMSGQTIFVLFMVLLYTLYIILFHHDYFENLRSIMMLYSLMIIFPVLVSLMVSHNFFSIYIIPFAIVPIFINVFLDSRTAFVTHLIMVLICAAAVKYQYEFIIIQLVAGLVAIYSLRELSSRAQVFKVAIFVTISSSVIYVTMQMMQGYDLMNI
ncbi:MAG: hydrolase, partial [Prevotella sp.]|nr:hydrolase [Prevotella sp.]